MQIKLALTAIAASAWLAGTILSFPAIAEDTQFGEDGMARNSKRDITAPARKARPAADHHKDVRGCLNAGKNDVVIKCANKSRPR